MANFYGYCELGGGIWATAWRQITEPLDRYVVGVISETKSRGHQTDGWNKSYFVLMLEDGGKDNFVYLYWSWGE